MDIVSLTSVSSLLNLNSNDLLQLNSMLLLIMKYHIRRMALNDVISLLTYMITTGLILSKNDDYYGLSLCAKQAVQRYNNDYILLFTKTLGIKHSLKLEQKLRTMVVHPAPSTWPRGFVPLVFNDIQHCILRIYDLIKQPFELKHWCRLLIRQNIKDLKATTINKLFGDRTNLKLHDYILYTPI